MLSVCQTNFLKNVLGIYYVCGDKTLRCCHNPRLQMFTPLMVPIFAHRQDLRIAFNQANMKVTEWHDDMYAIILDKTAMPTLVRGVSLADSDEVISREIHVSRH